MSAKTRTRTRKSTHASNGQKDKLVSELAQMELLGEIITWALRDNRGVHNEYSAIVKALADNDLDAKAVDARSPRAAFTRAAHELEKNGVIDIVTEDNDRAVFQLSKKQESKDTEEGGTEVAYTKQARIVLDKATGDLRCKDDNIKEHAKTLLAKHLTTWNTNDVSGIIARLFDSQGDLIPIGTGVFFVPKVQESFTDKVEDFLKQLGRKLSRFPVPAGTQSGDSSVATAVQDYLAGMLEDLDKAVSKFSLTTRGNTIAATAQRIAEVKLKVEAYALYLADRSEEMTRAVEQADARLLAKVEEIEEQRKTAPPEVRQGYGTVFGYAVTRIAHWMGKQYWSSTDMLQTLRHLGVQAKPGTLKAAWSEGKNPAYCKAADLSPEQVSQLETARDQARAAAREAQQTNSVPDNNPDITSGGEQ